MKNLPGKKPANLINSGDIFQLGEHKLACGDATDPTLITRLFAEQKANLVCSDPPYGVAYVESKQGFTQGNSHKIIANDHTQTEAEYQEFTKKWLNAITPFLAPKNALYIFNADKMLFALRAGMVEANCHFTQLLVWVKTQAVVGRLDYLPQHELIIYGWHGRHIFRKAKDKSVLVCPKPAKSKFHPTTKPISLIRRLILNSTKVGDIVYDGFGGSGSCLLACEQTKRKCLMVELDPEYCQTIISQWEKMTGQKALLLNSAK